MIFLSNSINENILNLETVSVLHNEASCLFNQYFVDYH